MGKAKEIYVDRMIRLADSLKYILDKAQDPYIIGAAENAFDYLEQINKLVEGVKLPDETPYRDPRQTSLDIDGTTDNVLSIFTEQRD